MALKLFRRKSKAEPVAKEPEEEIKKIVEVRCFDRILRNGTNT
jgi:hypothetical protein